MAVEATEAVAEEAMAVEETVVVVMAAEVEMAEVEMAEVSSPRSQQSTGRARRSPHQRPTPLRQPWRL
jgi:hypothetical protein